MEATIINNEECWPELGLEYDSKLLLPLVWGKDCNNHSYTAEYNLKHLDVLSEENGWILISNEDFKCHYMQRLSDFDFDVIYLEDNKVVIQNNSRLKEK
jgi:hypothetical protein